MDSTPTEESLNNKSTKLPIKRKSPDPSDPNPKSPPFKFHRIWTEQDEIRFLTGLLDGSSENLFFPRDLNVFYTRFSNTMSQPYTKSQLSEKLRRLRKKFRVICSRLAKGLVLSLLSPHDRSLYHLSKQLWHPDFALTSPFNPDKSKKSNLVGVKVGFLPTIASASGPGLDHDPTHDGVSLDNEKNRGIAPVPGPGLCHDPTHDGVSVKSGNGEFRSPGLGQGQDPTRDGVSVKNGKNGGSGENGGEVSFLPAIASGSGPGLGHDPTHDGVSVKNGDSDGSGEFGVKGSILPTIPSGSGQNQDPTHDGISVNNGNNGGSGENGVKGSILSAIASSGPGLSQDQDLTHDGVSVKNGNNGGSGECGVKDSILHTTPSVSGPGQDPIHDEFSLNDGNGEFGDEDGKLREVNVEFDRGEVGEKRVRYSCLDGPVQVGVGFGGVGEIAAKVVMDVFDECLKDIRNGVVGEKSNLDGFLTGVCFEERWKEQRFAEMDVLARRLRLVLEHSLHQS